MIASSRSPPRHRRKSNIAQKQLPGGRRGACCICGIASMAQGTQVCHCEAPTGPWQSHAGSCDFADGFTVVRPCSARLPRRFAPRNDTSGERAVHQCTCAVELPSARCSGNAATDAIGSYRFIARLFVSPVRRRERHAAPLQFSIEMRTKCAKKYRKHRLPVVSACQKSPFGLFRQAAFRIAK